MAIDQVPMRLTRPELVGIVQQIIGEVDGANRGRYQTLALWRGSKALRITVLGSNGANILGVWLVPFPPGLAEAIADPDVNPYNSIGMKVEPCSDVPLPAPVEDGPRQP